MASKESKGLEKLGRVVGTILGFKCPKCGSTDITREAPIKKKDRSISAEIGRCICNNCGHAWSCPVKVGCYITTVVCSVLGKDENCYELEKFRSFRDDWLIYQSDGDELIREYYEISPKILRGLLEEKEPTNILKSLWEEYLEKCLHYIESGEFEKAKELYISMVDNLKKKYL